MRTCTIDGCTHERWDGRNNKFGLCRKHMRRKTAFGDPLRTCKPMPRRNLNPCKYDHCTAEAITRGYCSAHYKKLLRAGTLQTNPRKVKPPKVVQFASKREQRRAWLEELVALHRANPITQALNW